MLQVEGAENMKMALDSWNIQTAQWLRYVCYDRVTVAPVALTMLLSAVWFVPCPAPRTLYLV